MRYASVCSGIGALDLVIEELFGAELAWYCEVDKDASKVMATHWPGVPNHGDIKAVDWSSVEPVDLLCGGPPCQSVSVAGKRLGPADERFLWPWVLNAVERLRPGRLVFENPPGIAPWLPAIVRRLADLGYMGRYGRLTADSIGAAHKRERVFIVAHHPGVGWERRQDSQGLDGDQAERSKTGPGQRYDRSCRCWGAVAHASGLGCEVDLQPDCDEACGAADRRPRWADSDRRPTASPAPDPAEPGRRRTDRGGGSTP